MSDVQGIAEAFSMFGGIEGAARDELGVEIAIISREILAAQKADVARDTGELEAALSLQLLLDRLRARIGLLIGGRDAGRSTSGRRRKAVAGGPFYGRIVERGRTGQTVSVTRNLKRRVVGNGKTSKRRIIYLGASKPLRRRGPNKGTPVGSPYKMRVRAMAARPYIAQPLLVEAADQHVAEYWSRLLGRAGGA